MTGDDDKLAKLLAYAQTNGHICPQPQEWNALWEMLPRRERVGGDWKPPLPLVLGAWWHTNPMEKQLRLRDHIEYAAIEGMLVAADSFLRGLSPAQWCTMVDR